MDDRFVNLGEEVILTLLWQSGASESATVSMFCYQLKYLMKYQAIDCSNAEFCVSCVRERERERERESHITVESVVLTAACVQTHTSFITESVTRFCSPRAWTDAKTKDIINCLYIYFERWSLRLWKGALHFRLVLVVFGQSQYSEPVGQSEQTVLVGRRD